jgi:hypothetical protein
VQSRLKFQKAPVLISPKAAVSVVAFAETGAALGELFLGQLACLLSSNHAVGTDVLGATVSGNTSRNLGNWPGLNFIGAT